MGLNWYKQANQQRFHYAILALLVQSYLNPTSVNENVVIQKLETISNFSDPSILVAALESAQNAAQQQMSGMPFTEGQQAVISQIQAFIQSFQNTQQSEQENDTIDGLENELTESPDGLTDGSVEPLPVSPTGA
jgi:hypothetical protein